MTLLFYSSSKWDSGLTHNVHLLHSNMDDVECKPSRGGALFFYQETDKMTFFTSQCGSNHTIASRQLVTNLAGASLPSACEPSTRDDGDPLTGGVGQSYPDLSEMDGGGGLEEELRSNLSDLFIKAEEPNVTLIMIIRKFLSILNNISLVVEADTSKVQKS